MRLFKARPSLASVEFAENMGVILPVKSPTERHADSLATVLENLRGKIANEQFDRDTYRELAAECEKRERELVAIMEAITPAYEKLAAPIETGTMVSMRPEIASQSRDGDWTSNDAIAAQLA